MPILRNILILSVCGNLCLAVMVMSAWRNPARQAQFPSASAIQSDKPATPWSAEVVTRPQWSELYSPDRVQFQKNLEDAGLPFSIVADLLRAERKLRASKERNNNPAEVADFCLKNFWNTVPANFQDRYSTDKPCLVFLSDEKKETVGKILKDYEDMERELLRALLKQAGDNPVREFSTKRKLLQSEKQRDLAAVFDSHEMELFELWNSSQAHSLRRQLNGFNPTEAEFRAIHQINHNQEPDTPASGGIDLAEMKRQNAADQAKQDALRTALGEERYRDYARTESNEYRDLVVICERFQLPIQTTNSLFDLRDSMAKESWRIGSDTTIPVAERCEQLKALAERTETRFRELAGPDAGPQLQEVISGWTGLLRDGTAVLYDRNSTSVLNLKPYLQAPSK